jgi:hypothetical protein
MPVRRCVKLASRHASSAASAGFPGRVPVGVDSDEGSAQFVPRVDLLHPPVERVLVHGTWLSSKKHVLEGPEPDPHVDRPLGTPTRGDRQGLAPKPLQIVLRESGTVLLEQEHADDWIVDVVVRSQVPDPPTCGARPRRMAAPERIEHALRDVVGDRPLTCRLRGPPDLRRCRADFDGLAEDAPAHQPEERLRRPIRSLLRREVRDRFAGPTGVALGQDLVERVGLDIRPIRPCG